MQAVVKLGKRCHEELSNSESTCEINVEPSKSKYHKLGAGRRATISDVREALFDWFIDIRSTLKARLPRKMFKNQCLLWQMAGPTTRGNPCGEKDRVFKPLDKELDERVRSKSQTSK